jgi:hypothetical protein
MPVIEYKLIKTQQGNEVPPYVKNGGNYTNPSDFSMVGWVDPEPRKYYVPDTIVELTELDFAERMLKIHSANPFMHARDESDPDNTDLINYMDSADVADMAINWYIDFVKRNS